MDFRKLLCLPVSLMFLTGTAHAEGANSFFLPSLNVQNQNNSSYEVAAMQFLPDWAESGGSFTGNSADGDYGGNEIKAKGCPEGYQTGGCTGDTPFTVSTTRAENGNSCYQCRAFEANDCQKDGYYLQSYWDALKPQAALNLPKESMFAEIFGNIFGFRNAHAVVTNYADEMEICKDCEIGGGITDTGGTTTIGGSGSLNGQLIDPLITLTRNITDEVVGANVYSFNKTGECKYNSSYVKGEWTASCDSSIYKYDSNNCSKIPAGKKCGDKWDGCYSCAELYTRNGIGVGPLEPGTTRVATGEIVSNSCSKTAEGCLYGCLVKLDLVCNTSNYPYTALSCSGTTTGSSCTTDAGLIRFSGCISSCTSSNYPYTTANCNTPMGLSCKDTTSGVSRYKFCSPELVDDNQGCTNGYSRTRPACTGTIVTDRQGCYCCNNPYGAQCIISSLDSAQSAM